MSLLDQITNKFKAQFATLKRDAAQGIPVEEDKDSRHMKGTMPSGAHIAIQETVGKNGEPLKTDVQIVTRRGAMASFEVNAEFDSGYNDNTHGTATTITRTKPQFVERSLAKPAAINLQDTVHDALMDGIVTKDELRRIEKASVEGITTGRIIPSATPVAEVAQAPAPATPRR